MGIAEIFEGNFFSFAEMLGGAPDGGVLRLGGMSFAASSGQSSAGENYVLLAEEAGSGDIERASRFFEERGAQFVLPWLPRTPQAVARTLEERGIERRRIYTSMYLPCENMSGKAPEGFAPITEASAPRWAETAWLAFGGAPGADALAYVPFGAYLATHGANRAFALAEGERLVSTALIHETNDAYGLYYFATMPDRRRRGLAAKLMDGVVASLPEQKPLVLLATEAGLPFYINYGFKIIDKVPIYSASSDI